MGLTRTILFNGVDLSALTGITIESINKDDLPIRNVVDYKLARTDGRKQISAFYDNRQITVVGDIIATDAPTFEANRATLLQNLGGQDLPIDIIINQVQERFYGTVSSLVFSQSEAGWGVFTLVFECSSPFGIDPNLQTALATVTKTTASNINTLSQIQGTYKCAPFISIYITSGTGMGLSTSYIKITNNSPTVKSLQITRAFSAGELITIDVFNKQVQVNRVNVDYTGNLDLFWDITANQFMQYDDNFTTRSVNLTFQYYPRFL